MVWAELGSSVCSPAGLWLDWRGERRGQASSKGGVGLPPAASRERGRVLAASQLLAEEEGMRCCLQLRPNSSLPFGASLPSPPACSLGLNSLAQQARTDPFFFLMAFLPPLH